MLAVTGLLAFALGMAYPHCLDFASSASAREVVEGRVASVRQETPCRGQLPYVVVTLSPVTDATRPHDATVYLAPQDALLALGVDLRPGDLLRGLAVPTGLGGKSFTATELEGAGGPIPLRDALGRPVWR